MLAVNHDNVVNMCVRTVRTVNTLMSRMHETRTKTDHIFIAKISPLLPSTTYHSISETLKSVLSSEWANDFSAASAAAAAADAAVAAGGVGSFHRD